MYYDSVLYAGPITKGMMEANCLQFQPGGEFLHLGGDSNIFVWQTLRDFLGTIT